MCGLVLESVNQTNEILNYRVAITLPKQNLLKQVMKRVWSNEVAERLFRYTF